VAPKLASEDCHTYNIIPTCAELRQFSMDERFRVRQLTEAGKKGTPFEKRISELSDYKIECFFRKVQEPYFIFD
jgi:hypothetical protein